MPEIRLLIVDDSLVMRRAIHEIVNHVDDIVVVGEAPDGARAIEMNAQLRPDVITMDVNMPVLDGIGALTQIMREAPSRVLMVSALTVDGAELTLQALEAGAVDILAKPTNEVGSTILDQLRAPLLDRIRAAATVNLDVQPRVPQALPERPPLDLVGPGERVVLIGSSTGGPQALQALLPALPADLPAPVLIVQHMPPTFTAQMARRLNSLCALDVSEAVDGESLSAGQVLIAPGDRHLVLSDRRRVALKDEPADADHRPSVDELFLSATGHYGTEAVAVVLTGMGRDGCLGARRLKAQGAHVIAQDRDTSSIYGMPRAVVEAGIVDVECPLSLIPAAILQALRA